MHTFSNLLHTPEPEIYFDLHELVKVYPTKTKLILYKQPNPTRIKGYEDSIPNLNATQDINPTPSALETPLERSIRRSKQLISDIVLCNEFELFTTFTFSKDRQDIELCKSKMSTWLKNQKRLHGKFNYLIVPEFHKDLKSIHFHALISDYRGKLVDSGKTINGRTNFNISSYRSGFSTAVKIDNTDKVSSYVKKYITKDMPTFSNKKRFWLSTGLKRPITLTNQNLIQHPDYAWNKVHENEQYSVFHTSTIIQDYQQIHHNPVMVS